MDGIILKDITYTYPGAATPALDGLNLTIPRNQWTTLIGRNGSGKSTIARLIDGLLVPSQGSIMVNGLAVTEENLGKLHQQVGIVFQNPENQFVGATVADDIAFGLENLQVPREKMAPLIKRSLERVGMTTLADAEPGMLSGGQKQRVAIAGILALEPEIIILDEATSMLDPAGRQTILDLINKLRRDGGLTIISITHDPVEMEMADQIVVVGDHHVIENGPAAEILQKTTLLRKLGVGIPTGQRLRDLLVARGVTVPEQYFTEDEMVKWLWQQLS
ncbi:energy-coupling factor transporter ATPase [Limosilactobacillus panis]|uniref:D-methionine ABC superfamily ATP binding cassette transporter, ABC protein n=1 Tax=Limosilactobacillus panis DSM 6035 TaxID=1423782 RepID=A0A0R1XFP3_9LACO|nr:energy-coupling factor transporter ATPase [Limosilactobacillus panis]KRM28903.1 D-methionine ABC superfamily ATP binding cassette transporter, ABC protein [Limosilactobacillus panis DSM 6035]